MKILFLVSVWLSAVLLILPAALLCRDNADEIILYPSSSSGQAELPAAAVCMPADDCLPAPSDIITDDKPIPPSDTEGMTAVAGASAETEVCTESVTSAESEQAATGVTVSSPLPSDSIDGGVFLEITGEHGCRTGSLRDYLIGVVMAEMPSYFHTEALRAQAVAARSYLLYRRERGYAIYDYGSSCTAHFSEEEGRAFFGDAYEDVLETVSAAVADTDGEILYYDGRAVCAAYHAMSYKCTADAADVWGGDTPYLCSVETPEPQSTAGMVTQYTFDEETLCRLLGVTQALPLVIDRNDDGRAASVTTASGDCIEGERFRSLLRLRAAAVEITAQDAHTVVLCVYGFGHGVGMSQYGADAYADMGKSYKEILAHYYPQTSLGLLS